MNPILVITILILIAVIFIIQWAFRMSNPVRVGLKKAGEKKMGEIVDGDIVKITGKIQLVGKTLQAPLSGRSCSCYRVLIRQRTGKTYATIHEEVLIGDVILRKDDYFILLQSYLVKSSIVTDRLFYSYSEKNNRARLEKYLEKNGFSSKNLLGFDKDLMYEEGILEQGELVTVSGKAKWLDKKPSHLENVPGRMLLISHESEENPVYLTDDLSIISD